MLGQFPKNDESRAICEADIRDTECCEAESVSSLPVFDFGDENTLPVSKSHLNPVVADAHSVTILCPAEFDNVSMLQRVGTLTQNDKLPPNGDICLLREAQERLLSPRMLQDDEHKNYYTFLTRRLAPAKGIHELTLSASSMSRSSFVTSSGVESSKKSIKSSNIFLDMTEDGATMPRIFSSLMMVMDDLFMNDSVAQGI